MTREAQLDRRSLLGSVVGGAVLGGIWGAAFPVLAMENRPTIAVIGHRNAQIVLVDSSEGRALILVGEPDDTLMDVLPAVMTLFRQRIDLVIASQPVLLRYAAPLKERWAIRHAISLQASAEASAPAMPTTTVTDGITVGLGGQMGLQCRIGHRAEWDARSPATSSALWTITIVHPGGDTAIAPDAPSLDAAAPEAATLLICPDIPPPGIAGRIPVQALACNYDSQSLEQNEETGTPLTRIYPRDIARFVLHDSGIDLPLWTQQP